VRIRSGPATVSAEVRSEYATGKATRWEGSFNPKKREPGDRLSSRRFESASKERSITIPELDRTSASLVGLAAESVRLSGQGRPDAPRRSFLSIRCVLFFATMVIHSVGRPTDRSW
jgi:hypothetical protein